MAAKETTTRARHDGRNRHLLLSSKTLKHDGWTRPTEDRSRHGSLTTIVCNEDDETCDTDREQRKTVRMVVRCAKVGNVG